jgi:hypothetical protein
MVSFSCPLKVQSLVTTLLFTAIRIANLKITVHIRVFMILGIYLFYGADGYVKRIISLYFNTECVKLCKLELILFWLCNIYFKGFSRLYDSRSVAPSTCSMLHFLRFVTLPVAPENQILSSHGDKHDNFLLYSASEYINAMLTLKFYHEYLFLGSFNHSYVFMSSFIEFKHESDCFLKCSTM